MTKTKEIHIWNHCHHCGMRPIAGCCFRCETCVTGPDLDLCAACYDLYREGKVAHPIQSGRDDEPHCFASKSGTDPESLVSWLREYETAHVGPSVPSGFLARPEFRHRAGGTLGGYSFVARFAEDDFLMTALHVMDDLIKMRGLDATYRNNSYTGKEIPALINSVHLYDVFQIEWMFHEFGTVGPMLTLPNARTGDPEPYSFRDIAAFWIDPFAIRNPLELAQDGPEPGEPVWLAAAMPDGTRSRLAVCVENSPHCFVFRYEERKTLPKLVSGAPILNREGKIVGINTGIGIVSGREFGHANPVESIRSHLHNALNPPRI